MQIFLFPFLLSSNLEACIECNLQLSIQTMVSSVSFNSFVQFGIVNVYRQGHVSPSDAVDKCSQWIKKALIHCVDGILEKLFVLSNNRRYT